MKQEHILLKWHNKQKKLVDKAHFQVMNKYAEDDDISKIVRGARSEHNQASLAMAIAKANKKNARDFNAFTDSAEKLSELLGELITAIK